ncbi:HHL090Wp [Eremothecium sinecaudum]|uniref:HHL090Wp n=1 Tax=Eremothecium sinecaudum TaxID=45286 RepID=A0A120K2V3_9SACH|nr:HHL090Wp [Eremothecium sinecaudum]AMD22680.1 HHL090Wp [Eremothecium sinecaudum]
MKLVRRFILFVIAVIASSHLYCSFSDVCPTHLSYICHYTTPLTYEPFVEEKFPAVKPWLEHNVLRHVNDITSDLDHRLGPITGRTKRVFMREVLPRLRKGQLYWDAEVVPRATETAKWAISNARFYYRVYVEPMARKLWRILLAEAQRLYAFGKLKAEIYYNTFVQPHLQQLKAYFVYLYHKFLTNYPLFEAVINHGQRHAVTIYGAVQKHFSVGQEYLKREFASSTTPGMASTVNVETSVDTEERAAIEDLERTELEETIYITSTVTKTFTASAELATAVTEATSAKELEVSLHDLIHDEFQAWKQTIENKADNVLKAFTDEIREFELQQLEEISPVLTRHLREFNAKSKEHFRKINKVIQEINCTMGIDPETNATIWFDKRGTQLKEYITRPLLREHFAQANGELTNTTDFIRAELKSIVDSVNDRVDVIREEHLEIYEEWGDVMISEWSKRMAYIDVVDHDIDSEEQRHNNWKQFLKLKKHVIKTRELLMEHPVKFNDLEKFLKDIQNTLRTMAQENGEYMYILRSKANLYFQEREKQDRAREKQESELATQTIQEQLSTDILLNNNASVGSIYKVNSVPQEYVVEIEQTLSLDARKPTLSLDIEEAEISADVDEVTLSLNTEETTLNTDPREFVSGFDPEELH